ncbi:S8 family serine peptidase [Streptomyces sp. TLI_171]|uniref:S8 family serine peptidase n=1 Tax=Streptomyces sp. TLI_171 TaxID=1938859 RepID=UPI000C46D84A|nr:S8 family serine peptidase [Streptomyces sp. TLI_171]RKE17618.1 subtilase family protein [Streptomyces sp. TLI_171]
MTPTLEASMTLSARIRGAMALAAAGILATGMLTSTAQASAAPPGGSATALTGRQSAAPRTVTLVTGDRVQVTTGADGRTAVTVLPDEHGDVPLTFTQQENGDQYVLPQRASAALAAGTVDRGLFNVSALLRQGYDDTSAKTLPLIATYRDARAADASPQLRARAAGTQQLKAVDGVAFKPAKDAAARTWDQLIGPDGRGRDGLAKLWLDRKVRAANDAETQQIGAPAAWAAGLGGQGVKVAVLDTGIDDQHPDLTGQVDARRNFTADTVDEDVHDAVGHGTFVASEIAGTGKASGGAERGVADQARLLVGKVLDDGGSGTDSQIIAGMQWAADAGADVVSMSLGSAEPSDCTDPMSTAAQRIAEQSKALFVVAAGNLGSYQSVSSPGCAPAVLTVGAVDAKDATAAFSSHGSVTGAHTLKPEIAAPGVDVKGAAAGGRGIYAYTGMSGTSMATPLVAGTAALVKQRHPEWGAAQIKAALVSSALPTVPGDVQQVGAGRLRADAATTQRVLGAPAVGFGDFAWPQQKSDTRTVQLPYTNTGEQPVTLKLAVQRTDGDDDSAVKAKAVRLGADKVTVPAGSTVQVPLTLDPTARLTGGQSGDLTGRVVATAQDGSTVATPFNAYVEPETLAVRVKLIDRDGRPAAADAGTSITMVDLGQATGSRRAPDANGEIVYRLRPGAYSLSGYVVTPDRRDTTGEASPKAVTALAEPEIQLSKDTVLTLDARKAEKIEVQADRDLRVRNAVLELGRWWGDKWVDSTGVRTGLLPVELSAWGAGKARTGGFEFASYLRLAAPEVVLKGAGLTLEPHYAQYADEAHLPATGSAALTAVADLGALAGADVKGKLVLLPDDGTSQRTVSTEAKNAGAVGVLTYRQVPGVFAKNDISLDAPVLPVTAEQAAALTAALGKGAVTLNWASAPDSPYVYNLAFHDGGSIGGKQRHTVRDRDLAAVTENWHSLGTPVRMSDYTSVERPWNPYTATAVGQGLVATPGARTAYYTADDTTWLHDAQSSWPFNEFMQDLPRRYQAGQQRTEDWYGGVLRPTAGRDADGKPLLIGERQADLIGVDFSRSLWGDGNADHTGSMAYFGDLGAVELLSGGSSLGRSWYGPFNVWEIPAAAQDYTLVVEQQRFYHRDLWQRSTAVRTEFGFRSANDPAAYSQSLPLLFPDYRLDLDGNNTAPAGPVRIGLAATGQAGYAPGPLTDARLSYSYDDGATWTDAAVGADRTALLDHTGASGKTVTLRITLASADGATVTQTVTDAYGVR